MSNIIINGKHYNVDGKNISIVNGTITVDGKKITENLSGVVKIEVTGSLHNLKCDASVTVYGDVNGNVSAGGSVSCTNIGENVQAGGSINCHDIINGDVLAGGSVRLK